MRARKGAAILLACVCASGLLSAQETKPARVVIPDENVRRTLIDESAKQPQSVDASSNAETTRLDALRTDLPRLDLQSRLKDVEITSKPSGDVVTIETEDGLVELSATEYVRALANTKAAVEHGSFFYKLFNISKPWGFVWISVGFLGQLMFTFRMVLQWWASEKSKRSVVPVGFWWGSLIGGAMLFAYFVWRKDIVGIVGQSTGVFVYARNLVLIYRGKRIETEAARTLSDADPDPVTT
ncbi:MAG: lipid-A-disaccharide synthase N-terminal domain-containing protein [Planctomycetota bacterium]|nr:lipid-A-disaccharide synthase N-terminal domain-containing protein [Planctomycetota bacterium]